MTLTSGPSTAASVAAAPSRRSSPLRHVDWLLLIAVGGLLAIGAPLIYSATRNLEIAAGGDPHAYLKKQAINITVAVVLGLMTALFDYRMLRVYAPFVYVLSVLGLLAVLSPLGSTINGGHSWIVLPAGFSVEPSEFVKLALCVALPMLLAERRDMETEPRLSDVGLALGVAILPIGLIMLEPDLGTSIIVGCIVLGILAVAGTPSRWLTALVLTGAVGAFVAVKIGVLKPYQIARFAAFTHPNQNTSTVGYNVHEARIAIGSGGLFGTGLLRGPQTNGQFVPEQQTDFIFTVAGEELGFVGGAVVILLVGLLLWRAARIAMRAEDLFGTLMAAGILCWFMFQAFENIGMALGIMPVTGVPLPFVSYGGTSLFVNMMAVGLLENVHMRRYV